MRKAIFLFAVMMMSLTVKAQYQLDTILYAGDSKTFTDIVFLGDGFKENEMDKFVTFVKRQAKQFFQKTPWKQYSNRFNVFYVKTPSNESGAGMTPDEPIDNFYGTCFGTSGVDRMPWPTKFSKVYQVLNAVKPDYDMVPIVVNSMKYGGGGGAPFICYSMEESSIETLRHEAGHAFGKLADEYWYQGNEAPNMTKKINPVKWERWVGDESIGTYRYSTNSKDEAYSWYRPHQNCLMQYLYRDYCAVCREALVERIHDCSEDIIAYEPTKRNFKIEDGEETVFSLDLLKPSPNTLRVEWVLDEETVALNVDSFVLAADTPEGTHRLKAIVEDTTKMVRIANHRSVHGTTVVWRVTVSNSTGIEAVAVSADAYKIGPLPFTSELTFSNKEPKGRPIRIELLNMAGGVEASDTFADDTHCSLATERLTPGVYVLRVFSDGTLIYTNKVMKR